MKRFLIVIGGVAVLGIGYWLVSPLFITRRVNEKLEDIMAAQPAPSAPAAMPSAAPSEKPASESAPAIGTISQGAFAGLAGHSGQGTAKLLNVKGKYFVRFEDDFRVTNGPDLFVYFGRNGEYVVSARLGALKGNEGGQNYEVPAGISPLDYSEVWVWCRAFSIPFAKAELR
jgi:hypothetical protein